MKYYNSKGQNKKKTVIYPVFFFLFSFLCSEMVYAQPCNDISISTVVTDSDCQSNGTITVSIEGADADYIQMTDIEYSIKSVISGGYNTQFAHVEDGLLTDVPPGEYIVEVRAFCIREGVWVTKESTPVTIGGNYQLMKASAVVARKSLNCNPATGRISVSVSKGKKSYTVEITSKPDSYKGETLFSDRNGNLSIMLDNLTPGSYTIKVIDDCGYSIEIPVEMTSVEDDLSADFFGTLVCSTGEADNNKKDILVEYNGSTTDLDLRTYMYASTFVEFYEIAFSVDDANPVNKTWTVPNFTKYNPNNGTPYIEYTLPYNYQEMRESHTLYMFVRVKNSLVQNCPEKSIVLTLKNPLTGSGSILLKGNCDNRMVSFIQPEYPSQNTLICYPYSWKITSPNDVNLVYSSGIANINIMQTSGTLADGNYVIHFADACEVTWSTSFTVSGSQLFYSEYNSYNECVVQQGIQFISFYVSGGVSIWPGTRIKYVSGPTPPPGQNENIIIPDDYTGSRVYPYRSDYSDVNSQNYPPSPGQYVFEITGPCVGTPQIMTINLYGNTGTSISYTTERVCDGLKINDLNGYITKEGGNSAPSTYPSSQTYFRIMRCISGGASYSTAAVSPGGSLLLPSPGTYIIGMCISQTGCAVRQDTIIYASEGLALNTSVTSAYVCSGDISGGPGYIRVSAKDGIPPYTYEIVGSSPLQTNNDGIFNYGMAEQIYTIKITDGCFGQTSSSFTHDISMLDLNTATIVTSPKSRVCVGDSIKINCVTLGNTSYTWTLPDGSTLNQQNLTFPYATTNMSGSYTVSVTPELCNTPMVQSIEILVDSIVKPTVEKSDIVLFLGSEGPSLATISGAKATEGNILKWESEDHNSIIPPISLNTSAAGTTTYYVCQANKISGCESERVVITVRVKEEEDFEVWNWEDLKMAIDGINLGEYRTVSLMQNIGIDRSSSGNGLSTGPNGEDCPHGDPARKLGSFGYDEVIGGFFSFWPGRMGWKCPEITAEEFTFEGNGRVISGLYFIGDQEVDAPAFFSLVNKASFNDLTLKTTTGGFNYGQYAVSAGGFVAKSTGEVSFDNCVFEGLIDVPSVGQAGGFVGNAEKHESINNSLVSGSINVSQGNIYGVGGFAGRVSGGIDIKGSISRIEITAGSYIGGMIGCSNNDIYI